MIQFDPPYKGTDKTTNFPIIVLGVIVVESGSWVVVIKDDGDMGSLSLEQVNVDWRWDPQRRTFISIDDPETS